MILGQGIVTKVDADHAKYEGTFPNCKTGERVYTILEKDLEMIMKCEEMILLRFPYRMSKSLVQQFPDEIEFTAKDGTKHKLFLDRKFYAANCKDMMWMRYVSVDQSFIEEQP